MTRTDVGQYWRIVTACLVRLFALPKGEATGLVRTFRAKMAAELFPEDVEFFYHREPFDTARQIAGTPLLDPIEAYQPAYAEIVANETATPATRPRTPKKATRGPANGTIRPGKRRKIVK